MEIVIKNQEDILLQETCDASVGVNFWIRDSESEMSHTSSQTFFISDLEPTPMLEAQLKDILSLQQLFSNEKKSEVSNHP